jgi:Zn-finger nucleic acid-binding protein
VHATRELEDLVDCPIDGETLLMTERQGVEIDYCPKCRGVWLDRGELDKLVATADDAAARDNGRGRGEKRDEAPKKKSSFFKDLFEFGQE